MSKTKKIIILIFVFIFAFTSLFSVYAVDLNTDFSSVSFGDFLVEYIQISITANGGDDLIKNAYVTPVDAYPGAVRFELEMYQKFVDTYDYLLTVDLSIPEHIADSNYFYLGSFDCWLRRNGDYTINEVYSSWRYSKYSGQQNSKYRITSYDSFPTVRLVYDTQTRGTYYTDYHVQFKFHSEQATDTLYFYLGNFDMSLVHPDGEILDNDNKNTSQVQSSISKTESNLSSSISKTESNITSNNNSNTSKVQSSISKTESSINSNADKNASDIKANQDKNAQDIKDHQTQLQEDEKNEANTTGNDGADSVGSAIPNDSDGFIDSLGNLVSAVSYNGTNCNWELPNVSIPKINGVIPKPIKLWDKLEIPFEFWISKIPSNILKLIQSVLTVALIVYCFKELYSIISYVLTLKGGGADE